MNNKAKKLSVSLLTTFVFVSFSQWLQLWTLNHHPHHHHHHHQLNSTQLSSAHCQEGRKKADQKPQKLTAQKAAKKSLAPRALSDHLLVVVVAAAMVVSMQRAFSAASPTNSLRLQSVCKLSSLCSAQFCHTSNSSKSSSSSGFCRLRSLPPPPAHKLSPGWLIDPSWLALLPACLVQGSRGQS